MAGNALACAASKLNSLVRMRRRLEMHQRFFKRHFHDMTPPPPPPQKKAKYLKMAPPQATSFRESDPPQQNCRPPSQVINDQPPSWLDLWAQFGQGFWFTLEIISPSQKNQSETNPSFTFFSLPPPPQGQLYISLTQRVTVISERNTAWNEQLLNVHCVVPQWG